MQRYVNPVCNLKAFSWTGRQEQNDSLHTHTDTHTKHTMKSILVIISQKETQKYTSVTGYRSIISTYESITWGQMGKELLTMSMLPLTCLERCLDGHFTEQSKSMYNIVDLYYESGGFVVLSTSDATYN